MPRWRISSGKWSGSFCAAMDLNAGSQRIQSLGVSPSAVGLPLPPDLFGIHAGSDRAPRRTKGDVDGLAALGALPAVSPRWFRPRAVTASPRSEEHTSELQSPCNLVCR